MARSFIGSTVAIVIGVISIGSQLLHMSTWVDMDNIVGGASAICGAVASRLAKERRLGLRTNSVVLRNAEMALLFIVVAIPIVQTVAGVDFATRPWSNLMVPLWTLIAYVYIRLKKATTTRVA